MWQRGGWLKDGQPTFTERIIDEADFSLQKFKLSNHSFVALRKTWTLVDMHLYFRRKFVSNIIVVFVPNGVLAIMACLPAWLSAQEIVARISLSLGLALSIVTSGVLRNQVNEAQTSRPMFHVGNLYILLCIVFIVISLFHSVIAFKFTKHRHKIDVFGRIFFPICIATFLTVYWGVCLNLAPRIPDDAISIDKYMRD